MTALSAGSMLSGFASVVADDLAPHTATWQLEHTATSAGATLSCAQPAMRCGAGRALQRV
ncbi:hypothetical protein EAS64_30480 [Trebonia kvetii]|uniref:Uncharacterized protein n=1 Tax=Trebonia kvetii TaxID=2480626 RepID=A0A6P2BRZ5_9ACTN|nr:hypothetical protein [Trebonia kvetii]TVZ01784.1 hypothetical protein EAS64_30480 [Trebonia kvetii]